MQRHDLQFYLGELPARGFRLDRSQLDFCLALGRLQQRFPDSIKVRILEIFKPQTAWTDTVNEVLRRVRLLIFQLEEQAVVEEVAAFAAGYDLAGVLLTEEQDDALGSCQMPDDISVKDAKLKELAMKQKLFGAQESRADKLAVTAVKSDPRTQDTRLKVSELQKEELAAGNNSAEQRQQKNALNPRGEFARKLKDFVSDDAFQKQKQREWSRIQRLQQLGAQDESAARQKQSAQRYSQEDLAEQELLLKTRQYMAEARSIQILRGAKLADIDQIEREMKAQTDGLRPVQVRLLRALLDE